MVDLRKAPLRLVVEYGTYSLGRPIGFFEDRLECSHFDRRGDGWIEPAEPRRKRKRYFHCLKNEQAEGGDAHVKKA